ncbi:MAG: carboxypeptidase-like regulatory domain-containing protein [Gemmatimonadota bacterium]
MASRPPRRGRRRAFALAPILLWASALWLRAPGPLAGQAISGQVSERASGRAVAGADVALLQEDDATSARVTTDAEGRFYLPLPRSGTHSLLIEALGYAPARTEPIHVDVGERVEIVVALSVDAIELTPVVVTARRTNTRTLRDFERRRRTGEASGFGVFLAREELDRTFDLATPLTAVVGLPRTYDGAGDLHVGSSVCPGAVFLDGILVGNPGLNQFVLPTDLEGVEVYRRRSEIPIDLRHQIGDDNLCSAVVLWTRQGQVTRGGRAWLRFGLLGALVGGFLILVVGG